MTTEKVNHIEIDPSTNSILNTQLDKKGPCSTDPTADSPSDSSKPFSPFDKLKISSTKPLEAIVGCDSSEIPRAKLPIKVDSPQLKRIKHDKEKDGKSTVAHAKIIAPDDVEIYSYFRMPKFESYDRILLLFPGPDSKTLQEIPRSSFDKLLIVDGTWRQASSMAKYNPELIKFRKVTIKPQKTLFWRYQREDESHLATVEALYYFLKEYYETYEIPKEIASKEGALSYGYDGRKRKGKKPLTSRQRDKFDVI
ncbi:15595_t:CDS:2 [Acaulospora morrowiae]|uniref:tRNA-uridine aminocarboxypropyltransferase 1 n=1 Tax=Acaulospora morrowiae TaxID=94023 RepID=A0A9N8VUD0_9GLOM|nr:15595_t:CDS:2 [Acaulospora morrowiae]